MTLPHMPGQACYEVLSVADVCGAPSYVGAMIDAAGLKEELKKPGRSQSALARFMRLDQASVNRICAGTRQIKLSEASQIEAYLKATSRGLEAAMPPSAQAVQMLPIRHRVQAGAWLQADLYRHHDYGEGPIPADPRLPVESQWLEEVVGESMNRVLPSGALIHVFDAIAIDYTPRDGDLVVVERSRHQGREIERSVKQVRMHGRSIEFIGNSNLPEFNEPIPYREGSEDDVVVRIAGWVRHSILKHY
jgi:hypothetical protein